MWFWSSEWPWFWGIYPDVLMVLCQTSSRTSDPLQNNDSIHVYTLQTHVLLLCVFCSGEADSASNHAAHTQPSTYHSACLGR